ncbi:MAG: 4Fe-4S dicluster domain-containing protein [Candidatus Helarchaeota archaeon]|nr:4Fe-4S dicluster domain-containing protein [Candidatus Helarchaeota archaeon]
MKEKILQKNQLSKFIEELTKNHKVLAPVKKNGFYVFKEVRSADEISMDFANTKIPPKEIFFPYAEVLFNYKKTKEGIEIIEAENPSGTQIIFGIRPCDAKSFLLLDKFFALGKFQDPYYQKRREKTKLIGLACIEPLSTCLCTTLGGSPFGEEGMDVLLTDLGDKYLVKSLNMKGDTLIETMDWLEDASEKDLSNATEATKKALAIMKKEISLDNVAENLDKLFSEEKFWLQYSQPCIGCGTCTFLCPTCHCFDVTDEETPSGGMRIRLWDACQFPIFTKHGSGHNPRPNHISRMRQRIMHKFNYYPKVLSEIGCVGCGRCIFACPGNIDIRVVLNNVQET